MVAKNDNTYDSLIEAGIRLFGDNDFSKVSTRELTKQAGACLGAIFYHFGSKEELYNKVVRVLAEEAVAKIDNIITDEFQNKDITQMQLEIRSMVYGFNDLIISEHGISYTNILNREAIPGNNSEVAHIIRAFSLQVRNILNNVLIIYYSKTGLAVGNAEFIISLMFSILKNRLVRNGGFYDFDNYKQQILDKMIDLVLYQKLPD